MSNLIETAALARIRAAQFVDDAETAEILGNEALVRRLKTGSRQARRRIRKLRGYAPETWRYRIGSWRFFCEVDDDDASFR